MLLIGGITLVQVMKLKRCWNLCPEQWMLMLARRWSTVTTPPPCSCDSSSSRQTSGTYKWQQTSQQWRIGNKPTTINWHAMVIIILCIEAASCMVWYLFLPWIIIECNFLTNACRELLDEMAKFEDCQLTSSNKKFSPSHKFLEPLNTSGGDSLLRNVWLFNYIIIITGLHFIIN